MNAFSDNQDIMQLFFSRLIYWQGNPEAYEDIINSIDSKQYSNAFVISLANLQHVPIARIMWKFTLQVIVKHIESEGIDSVGEKLKEILRSEQEKSRPTFNV